MLAPAKVNLVLRTGPRRADGYHALETLLVALDVGDEVALEPAAATSVEAPALEGGDTLVTGALHLLARQAGHPGGWRVRIEKRVPVGAGLGGGSSDAGVALRLANATLPRPLPVADLVALAAQIGSDVPFFALGQPSAIATGRGELVEAAPLRATFAVALAWPGESVATAAVYAAHRAAGDIPAGGAAGAAAAIDALALAPLVVNDLALAAESLAPASAALRRALLERGALAACVSGSGSAVFGLFASRDEAQHALHDLPGVAWRAAAEPLRCHP